MVNSCANPDCHKTLRYLREGVVYLFSQTKHAHSGASDAADAAQRMEHFWLCGSCAAVSTLKTDSKGHVQLTPKVKRRNYVPVTESPTAALPFAV